MSNSKNVPKTRIKAEVVEPQGFKAVFEGQHQHFKKEAVIIGDTPAEIAQIQEWIDLGWCKDCDTGEVGDRTPGAQKLKVNDVTTEIK